MTKLTDEHWHACQMYQEGVFTIRMGQFMVQGLCGSDRARLIAASPKLLAAAIAVRDALRTGKWEYKDNVDGVLSAAIAEATGEQS